MNRHSFVDAASGKRSSLHNELDNGRDDDDDDDASSRKMMNAIDGEEGATTGRYKPGEDEGELEAFNLQEEREGDLGHFDTGGNFVFKPKEKEEDSWLSGLDEAAIEKSIGEAAAAKRRQEESSNHIEEKREEEHRTSRQLQQQLVTLMKDGETVAQSLRRLSSHSSNTNSNHYTSISSKAGGDDGGQIRRRRKGDTNLPIAAAAAAAVVVINTTTMSKDEIKQRKEQLNLVTYLADQLLTRGWSGIYQMKRVHIWAECWFWEYKDNHGNIQGPFTAKEIGTWKSQGYFTGDSSVSMRRVDPNTVTTSTTRASSSSVGDARAAGGSRKRTAVHFADSESNSNKSRDDIGGESMPSVKRSRPNDQSDLLADLDSDSEDDVSGSTPAAAPIITQNFLWQSSDSIDFGIHFMETTPE